VPATIGVGKFPLGVGADPETGAAYVANVDSDTVSVLGPCGSDGHQAGPAAG